MSDLHSARAVMATRAVTFRAAARLLAADAGDDAAILYAFCRRVDDLADEHADLQALDALRAEILGESPAGPEASTFLSLAARRRVPVGAAVALIDGARSDLGRVRIADDAALLRYAYAVAGTVGQMMAPLLGARGTASEAPAVQLGVAMQLTNIARDVLEDAHNGRVYLPCSRLIAAGVDPEALVHGSADRAAVAGVVREVLDLAEGWYRSAEAGMQYLPVRSRLAVLVAARTYRAIGRKLLRNGGDALAGRTVLSTGDRMKAAVSALFSWPWPQRAAPDPALTTSLAGLPEPR